MGWLTGCGSEVGEKLQGVEVVHPSYLAGARMAGRAGGASELHGNKAKLLEGLVWIEERRGELSTAARSDGNGVQRR
jgi:hypothetical protein